MSYGQFKKERANEVLNRNNEIATLQKNLEQCAVETLGAQNNVDSSIRNMSDKVLQLGQVRDKWRRGGVCGEEGGKKPPERCRPPGNFPEV